MSQADPHTPLIFDDKLSLDYDEVSELNMGAVNLASLEMPSLRSGTRTISVSQSNVSAIQGQRYKFETLGPQLQWSIGASHDDKELGGDESSLGLSVSPGPGKTADPQTLPHVAFQDPDLPWARNASTKAIETGEMSPVPWFALVAFTADELALADGESSSFFPPGPNGPNAKLNSNLGWNLEAGAASKICDSTPPSDGISRLTNLVPRAEDEVSTVSTSVIAIKRALFAALFSQEAPHETSCSISKYRLLAHVRETRSIESDEENSSTSSVVISHRTGPLDATMPTRVYVHLISLEGIDGIKTTEINQRVLLTSLYSWSYTAVPGLDPRAATLEQLGKLSTDPTKATVGLPMLRANYEDESKSKGKRLTPAQEQVMRRSEQGYSLVRYRVVTGEQTAAFTRGAFVPVRVPHPSRAGFPPQSNSGTDLQFLDRELGMLDISYSAAWSLGRALAMADQPFTAALQHLRQAFHDSAMAGSGNRAIPENAHFATIQEWVLNKAHLSGIPAQYLISDPSSLPQESLRFFYIDQNWIDSLVDGAVSLGNAQGSSSKEDPCRTALKAKLNEFLSRPIDNPKYLRKPPVYGFLLRSEILGEFSGLDVKAEFEKQFHAQNELGTKGRAPVLQRWLSEDTLLVLFCCEPPTLQKIKLALPIHHGPFAAASALDKKQNIMEVEFVGAGTSEPSLKQFQLSSLFDWDSRTIKIHEYAKIFEDFLNEAGGKTDPITPAGFGLMLRGRVHTHEIHLVTSS